MLNKISVLLNIFNVILIIFIASIFYGQKQSPENTNGYLKMVKDIHNNVRQNPTTTTTTTTENKNVVVEEEVKKVVEVKEEAKDTKNTSKVEQTKVEKPKVVENKTTKENSENIKKEHIDKVQEVSQNVINNDTKKDEKTFDFKNVEETNNKTNFVNNIDKTFETVTENLIKSKEQVQQVEEVKNTSKVEQPKVVEEKLVLNMNDHSKDDFIVARTIKTDKRINIYGDINQISKTKLKGDLRVFVSKQVYDGYRKLMYNDKIYLINKTNIVLN